MKHIHNQGLRLLLTIITMLLIGACSLGSSDDEPAEETQIAQLPTDSAEPTNTPVPTSTAVSTAPGSSGGNVTASPTCTPRADWTITYTVVAGDTLGGIARRTGTTTDVLATGNCITNPNTIRVGQQIRVPRQPTAPTATSRPPLSQEPPPIIGGAAPSESISGDAGFVLLLRDSSINVRWFDAPDSGISRVKFLVLPSGWTWDFTGPGTIEIGEDSNGADGWSVPWTVPASLRGELVAWGYNAEGGITAYSFPLNVASAPNAATACRIRPNAGATVNYHQDYSENAPVLGSLDSGNAVPILGRSLNGWYAISTNADFSGAGGVASLVWVPVDAAITEEGNNC